MSCKDRRVALRLPALQRCAEWMRHANHIYDRLRRAVCARFAAAGTAVQRFPDVQLRRGAQRCGARAGRGADQGRHRRDAARRRDARHVRARQRAARLSAVARFPQHEAGAHGRHGLHAGRNPDDVGLAAGDRPRQQSAACTRRHRHCRARQLRRCAFTADAARRERGRHSARWRRHAARCAGIRAQRTECARPAGLWGFP